MFCYQCQEAAKGTGCTIKGVCGKTDDLSASMDVLIFVSKGVSIYANEARKNDILTPEADKFVFDALFMTITNANFDKDAIFNKVKEGIEVRIKLENELKDRNVAIDKENLHESATW